MLWMQAWVLIHVSLHTYPLVPLSPPVSNLQQPDFSLNFGGKMAGMEALRERLPGGGSMLPFSWGIEGRTPNLVQEGRKEDKEGLHQSRTVYSSIHIHVDHLQTVTWNSYQSIVVYVLHLCFKPTISHVGLILCFNELFRQTQSCVQSNPCYVLWSDTAFPKSLIRQVL